MTTTATYTAGQICTAAFRQCGVVAIDRDAEAEEMDIALMTLNVMLKAIQIPTATLWKISTGSITITDATASYAVTGRPVNIDSVNYRRSGADLPMLRLTWEEYRDLPDKASAGQPTQFHYQRLRETATLYVWPVLATAAGETLEWSGRAEIEDVAATTDTLDVPGEWYEAIIYGLADRLCDAFPVAPQRRQIIMARAESALRKAEDGDRPDVVRINPWGYR
jgi:hypothetical protein